MFVFNIIQRINKSESVSKDAVMKNDAPKRPTGKNDDSWKSSYREYLATVQDIPALEAEETLTKTKPIAQPHKTDTNNNSANNNTDHSTCDGHCCPINILSMF